MTETTLSDVLAEARAHGLELTTDADALGGIGLDYAVAEARDPSGTVWMLRAPRRPEVYEGSLLEARVLSLVRPHLPADVPDWRVHTPNLVAYPRLLGTPAVSVGEAGPVWHVVDPAAPSETFLASYAQLLAALQAIPTDAALAAGVPVKPIAERRQHYATLMDRHRALLEVPDALWASWQSWLAADDDWPPFTSFVHGDLHPGHLLLDDDGRITGVLDWTEAHLGDMGTDFGVVFGGFGAGVLARVIARFEAAGGRTWPGVQRHATGCWRAFPVLAADWGARTDNDFVLAFARSQVAESAAAL